MPESLITFTAAEVSTYYAARLQNLKDANGRERRGPCPVHGGKDDNFVVNPETGQWFCFSACNRGGDILGLEMTLTGADFKAAKAEVYRIIGRPDSFNGKRPVHPNITATYDYTDAAGRLLYQAVRLHPKDFYQRRPSPDGAWINNLKDVRLVLYRLPELLRRHTETVFVCEGEKDVHCLEGWGLLATCNPMGAGKWRAEYSEAFRGRSVVILPDNDDAGRKHAAMIVADLLGVADSVRIVELSGLPEKGDVCDWRDAGGTLEQFREIVKRAQPMDSVAFVELRALWGTAVKGVKRKPVQTEAADDWPKPEQLQSELPAVEAIDELLLPTSFRPLVADVTERMQVPMDFPAVVMVLGLAGAVNRRAVIQPKANDYGWVVVPNVWGGIVAPPGFMKSPVIQAGVRPLNQIQTEWRREHEETLKQYALAVEEWELRKSAWKQLSTAQLKKSKAPPERPTEPPPRPLLRRLIVNDATFEAMHQTMSENPAGIFVIRDELTGWWSALDRAGREGERAFCLQAWNGDTGHTIDRIGRGTIHVEACCMSMLGGIQPGRLRSYLVDAIKDGPGNDGLIQRFQLLVWPDTPPDWAYVDRAPNAAAEQKAALVLRRLLELEVGCQELYRFTPAAQTLFVEWLEDLEKKVRGDDLHPALQSHLSKFRSLMPSLALLFELADRAGFDGYVGSPLSDSEKFVSLEHTRQAAAWCDYLESHARRVYSCVATPQVRAARELADHLRKRQIRNKDAGFDWFAARDVYLKGWTALDTPEAVKAAIEVLEDAGWVRAIGSEPSATGGRPSSRYCVNPRVWE
jgi:Protein of unknown function (DUF3987)/CHC2 zinc finger